MKILYKAITFTADRPSGFSVIDNIHIIGAKSGYLNLNLRLHFFWWWKPKIKYSVHIR